MKFLLLSVLAVAMIGVMVPSAFAEYNEQVSVKAIFVSTIGECSDKDWIQINTILGMTSSYLGYYNINALPITRDCVPISEFPIEIQSAVTTNDLVVVIPDTLSSLLYILKTDAYGHFSFGDEDRLVIVSEAVSFGSFTNQQKIWTLSHELSHYALYEYGYPREVFGEEVHVRQDALYQCEEYDPTFASCTNLWVPLESSYTGKKYLAMRPLYIEPYMTQEQTAENSYSDAREQYALDYQSKRWDYYNELKNKINSYSYSYDYQSSTAQNYIQKANEKYQSSNQLLNTIYQNLRNADQLLANGSIESAITQYSNSGTELMAANSDINLLFNYRDLAKSAENQFQSQNIPTCSRIGAEGDYSYDKGVLAYYQEKYDKNKQQLNKIAISGERNDAYFTALNANQNLGNLLDEIKSSLEKVKIFLSNEDFCEASERLDDIEDYKFTKLDQHNSIVENYLEDDSTENLTFGQSDSRSGKDIAWEKLNYVYDNFISKRADNSAYPLSERMTELNSKGFANNFKSEHEEMRQIYQELNRLENFDIPELYDLGHDNYKNQDYDSALYYLERAEELVTLHKNKKKTLSLMIQNAYAQSKVPIMTDELLDLGKSLGINNKQDLLKKWNQVLYMELPKYHFSERSIDLRSEYRDAIGHSSSDQNNLLTQRIDEATKKADNIEKQILVVREKINHLMSPYNPEALEEIIVLENMIQSTDLYMNNVEQMLEKPIPQEYLIEISENDDSKTQSLSPTNSESTSELQQEKKESTSEGGGCLIATAAFGSEMAPQVQFLRELRDNTVMSTQSGTAFMNTFNQFYYSFSPQIADYERENPVFKEAVKVTLTPLLTSLTLLNYVEIDSEEEMLGYGIGIILLNVGMYFVAPAVLIISLKKKLQK